MDKLLLIEDDTMLSPFLIEGLSDDGFDVYYAPDGRSAIEALDETIASFAAVITDIRLGPGPSGWDVGRHARSLAAHIPVLYMSGDSAYEWTAEGVEHSVMLAKPFRLSEFSRAITKLLGPKST